MRKSAYKKLEEELAKVQRENKYLWLYIQDRESQREPSVSVTLSDAKAVQGESYYEAHWYQADRSDKGYVAVIYHYGPHPNNLIVYVMPWADMCATIHDHDMIIIRYKLELDRMRLKSIPSNINI